LRQGLGHTRWSIERIALGIAALVWCAALGLLAARILTSHDSQASQATVVRTHAGVTETGVLETVTVDGAIKRVVKWRTREGTVTQTIESPMQFRTLQGDPVRVAGPTETVDGPTKTVVRTVTLPGSTVTLPGETVQNTVTEVNTVTETVQNTVTETVTETVIQTPGPP
jgi:hypothetical protein